MDEIIEVGGRKKEKVRSELRHGLTTSTNVKGAKRHVPDLPLSAAFVKGFAARARK